MRLVDRVPAKRILTGGLTLAAVVLLTTACQPEPVATPSATSSATVGTAPAPSGSPTATGAPETGFDMPTACENIYSADMLASLQSANPPLNDPGVTMYSAENAELLELIHSGGAPTLRCSWGQPSDYGLATNVTAIDAAQADVLAAALPAAGFGCEPLGDGTLCRIEQRGITLDDIEYTRGEVHYIGAGAVVTTAWINFAPEGYTEDIVSALWG